MVDRRPCPSARCRRASRARTTARAPPASCPAARGAGEAREGEPLHGAVDAAALNAGFEVHGSARSAARSAAPPSASSTTSSATATSGERRAERRRARARRGSAADQRLASEDRDRAPRGRRAPRAGTTLRKLAGQRAANLVDEVVADAPQVGVAARRRGGRTARPGRERRPFGALSIALRRSSAIGTFWRSGALPSRIDPRRRRAATRARRASRSCESSGATSASATTRPAWRAPIVTVPSPHDARRPA